MPLLTSIRVNNLAEASIITRKTWKAHCTAPSNVTPLSPFGLAFSWEDDDNRRTFLEWVANDMLMAHPDQWYKITTENIISRGGKQLLGHGNSIPDLLSSLYPQYEWKPWLFDHIPHGWWEDLCNQRMFMDWMTKQMGFSSLDCWYGAHPNQLRPYGATLLTRYNYSLSSVLQSVYEDHHWHPWLFEVTPHGFWNGIENHHKFFEWLGYKLKIQCPNDWYKVTATDLKGSAYFAIKYWHGGTLSGALENVYPEYRWQPWLFQTNTAVFWQDTKNHIKFLNWFACEANLDKPEDWYHVDRQDIIRCGGTPVLQKYDGSVLKALKTLMPEYPDKPWIFNRVSSDYFDNTENQQRYIHWLAEGLAIHKTEQWYQVEQAEIKKLSGELFLQRYNDSVATAITSLYPEYPWENWLFAVNSNGFWDEDNEVKYIEWLTNQLGIDYVEKWYDIKVQQIVQQAGTSFLRKYEGSVLEALSLLYPDYFWLTWKSDILPSGYWENEYNQQKLIWWAGTRLGVKNLDDWHKLKMEMVLPLMEPLFNKYGTQSLYTMLCEVFPFHEWKAWLFEGNVPVGFWEDTTNEYYFFQWFADNNQIDKLDQWYEITLSQIYSVGGETLLRQKYGNSLNRALYTLYYEFPWSPWNFDRVPVGFWHDDDNISKYMSWLSNEFEIKELDDWYGFTDKHVQAFNGITLIVKFKGLFRLLQHVYPHHSWNFGLWRSYNSKMKSQRLLVKRVRSLFPDAEIKEDYYHPDLKYSTSNKNMQLDIWLPKYSLAFEFQGGQHYGGSQPFLGNYHAVQLRDAEKMQACTQSGIVLIHVPYWWDIRKSSLAATIHQRVPSLLTEFGNALPIPDVRPSKDSSVSEEEYATDAN